MLKREVAIYRRLQQQGVNVSFVTYGDSRDLGYANTIVAINILCNRWGLPRIVYERLLHRLHGRVLRSANVFKTNQTNGADIALRAARHWDKPLIARCGYMWSYHAARDHGINSDIARRARLIESKVFSAAQRVVVTTSVMKTHVCEHIPEACSHLVVIPNYVDTEHFRPAITKVRDLDIIFVGRFTPQKNVEALLRAVQTLDVRTFLIGSGELHNELQRRFASLNDKLHWVGNVPNSELPNYFNRSRLFVLPSLYEGHPKTLVEAMSCGLPVIGADSPGIREIIHHEENGWLCGVDSKSIRQAIQHLLGKPGLCSQLAENARKYVQKNFALDRIANMEEQILRDVTKDQKRMNKQHAHDTNMIW